LTESHPLANLYVDGKIIQKYILFKWGVRVWTGFVCIRLVAVICSCENTIGTFCSINGGEFLDLMSNY